MARTQDTKMLSDLRIQRALDAVPWRLSKIARSKIPVRYGHYCVLNPDPLVILIPEDFYDEADLWAPFFRALADTEVHFVGLARWAVEQDSTGYVQRIGSVVAKHRSEFPRHKLTFLANNAEQTAIHHAAGLNSLDFNQNAFGDEGTYKIDTSVEQRFDAIYNAVCSPYKRHELAKGIDRLALITYFPSAQHNTDSFPEVAKTLSAASWLNFPAGDLSRARFRRLNNGEVCRHLNEAKVGLCLSHSEGAMLASIEYLLCGLPIVSTPSIGGRDAFFSPDYVKVVEPRPEAVRDAVQELIARRIDREFIRRSSLSKMNEHRDRLLGFIGATAANVGKSVKLDEVRGRLFPSQIYKLRPLHRVLDIKPA